MTPAIWNIVAWIGLGVMLSGSCFLGWAAGDHAFGPQRVYRRARLMAAAAAPATVFGLITFAVAVWKSVEITQ
jgi:hypothetical protein